MSSDYGQRAGYPAGDMARGFYYWSYHKGEWGLITLYRLLPGTTPVAAVFPAKWLDGRFVDSPSRMRMVGYDEFVYCAEDPDGNLIPHPEVPGDEKQKDAASSAVFYTNTVSPFIGIPPYPTTTTD